MRNIKILFMFVILAGYGKSLFGASYIGLFNGNINQEFLTYTDIQKEDTENLKGNTFGLELGYFLTNSMAIEVGYTDLQFKNQEVIGDSFTFQSDIKGSLINYGFRWYLAEYLNFRLGVNRSKIQPNYETSGSLKVRDKEITEVSQYYGVGVGMTFSKMQVYLDWISYPNEDGENGSAYNTGLKLFF